MHRLPNARLFLVTESNNAIDPITGNLISTTFEQNYDYTAHPVDDLSKSLSVSIEPEGLVNFIVPRDGRSIEGIKVTGRLCQDEPERLFYNTTYILLDYSVDFNLPSSIRTKDNKSLIYVTNPITSRFRLDRIFGMPFQGIIYNH